MAIKEFVQPVISIKGVKYIFRRHYYVSLYRFRNIDGKGFGYEIQRSVKI